MTAVEDGSCLTSDSNIGRRGSVKAILVAVVRKERDWWYKGDMVRVRPYRNIASEREASRNRA